MRGCSHAMPRRRISEVMGDPELLIACETDCRLLMTEVVRGQDFFSFWHGRRMPRCRGGQMVKDRSVVRGRGNQLVDTYVLLCAAGK